MREILFRGQMRKKGEKVRLDGTPVDGIWIYGGVTQGKWDHSIIHQTEPEIGKYPVYTDTLGQYIGRTDKHGKRIFEGDICKNTENGKTAVVKWYEEYSSDMLYCKSENCIYWLFDVDFEKIEVIGNIHDNPELLKGE
ncbi:MAG: hypothetical protein IJN57_03930 [Oscillospiraceae bacterium]|nr:hypothetical protein [Oscillospiraceae bacterium]